MSSVLKAGIIGTGSYVGEKVVTNLDLEKIVDTSDEWISTRTGIKRRRIANENTYTSDLAYKASLKALEDANLNPSDIDLIILATLSPDMPFPATACIVQSKLKAINAAAFDLSAGCTGFVYGLTVAKAMIESGMYKNILVIGAEVMSKILDWTDRSTCVLFGDGAGAAVVSGVKEYGIDCTYIKADGDGAYFLNQPAGGSQMPATEETVKDRLHFVKMNGTEVFKFAVRAMANSTNKVLTDANLKSEDIDLFIPHQANIRIIDSSVKKMKLEPEKVFINLHEYGNMSAAALPVALDEAYKEGRIKKGDNVLLVAFGAGLTYGSLIFKSNF